MICLRNQVFFAAVLEKGSRRPFRRSGNDLRSADDTAKDQRVYYLIPKKFTDNKFGTANPVWFRVVDKRINLDKDIEIRCNGIYSFRITDPLLFYTSLGGNVTDCYEKDRLLHSLKTGIRECPAAGICGTFRIGTSSGTDSGTYKRIKDAMNRALKIEWTERRGIEVQAIALNPITLTEEDMKKINQMEDAATLGSNPFMMAGRMTDATANAMENAASNPMGQ